MSRRSRTAVVLFLGCWMAACATLSAEREAGPEARLDRALAALEREDYGAAREDLVWVYTNHWDEPIGREAFLVLAATELDPRNPRRRLRTGAQLTEEHLRTPGAARWMEPIAETLYLLAVEIGETEERAERAEAEVARAQREAERARVAEAEAQADARRARAEAARAQQAVTAQAPPAAMPAPADDGATQRIGALAAARNRLAAENAGLNNQLSACRQELQRIRETLGQP